MGGATATRASSLTRTTGKNSPEGGKAAEQNETKRGTEKVAAVHDFFSFGVKMRMDFVAGSSKMTRPRESQATGIP